MGAHAGLYVENVPTSFRRLKRFQTDLLGSDLALTSHSVVKCAAWLWEMCLKSIQSFLKGASSWIKTPNSRQLHIKDQDTDQSTVGLQKNSVNQTYVLMISTISAHWIAVCERCEKMCSSNELDHDVKTFPTRISNICMYNYNI